MIDCKTIAAKHKRMLREYIQCNELDIGLAVIQVGDNPASNSYIKGKRADCEEVGVRFEHYRLSEDKTTLDVLALIRKLNAHTRTNGIIVQLPLPAHMDMDKIIRAIAEEKDVDGFKEDSKFTPCTPLGVMMILESLDCDVEGKVCCVIGRGDVGKPMVDLLTSHDATVVWCNSKTPYTTLKRLCAGSDIIISAVGKPGLIAEVSNHQVAIDVGISRGADGKLYGDVSKAIYNEEANITPVPGGVGLMTRVALLENTVYGTT